MTALAMSQFQRIAQIAMGRWGLNLTDRKMQLVSNRLAKLLRKSRFNDVQEYLEHLEAEADENVNTSTILSKSSTRHWPKRI